MVEVRVRTNHIHIVAFHVGLPCAHIPSQNDSSRITNGHNKKASRSASREPGDRSSPAEEQRVPDGSKLPDGKNTAVRFRL